MITGEVRIRTTLVLLNKCKQIDADKDIKHIDLGKQREAEDTKRWRQAMTSTSTNRDTIGRVAPIMQA